MTGESGQGLLLPAGRPATGGDRGRQALGWVAYASGSAAGAALSALMVWLSTDSAYERFGYVAVEVAFGVSLIVLLAVTGIVVLITKNDVGLFNLLSYAIVTVSWCVLVWRIPNAVIYDYSYASIARMTAVGGWVVALSMFSVMMAVWVSGVERIPLRVRGAVLLGALICHVPAVIWLAGRPPA